MKIGLVTFHAAHNYGAMLQAYALQDYLTDQFDCRVEFVNYFPAYAEEANRKYPRITGLRNLIKATVLLPFKASLIRRYDRFEVFKAKFLQLSGRYLTYESLEKSILDYDLLIVGSDQVWNLQNGGNPFFFLTFNKQKIPAIAYAPSFGTEQIQDELRTQFEQWVLNYDRVSVREDTGKTIFEGLGFVVQDKFGEVPQVVDPVFLKEREFWSDLASERQLKSKYIAFYSLETSTMLSECVTRISKFLRLPVVILGKPGSYMGKIKTVIAIDAGPNEFLSWVKNAEMVVTNSFHATAFSSVFEVPYIVIAHSSRNSRMESLLRILRTSDRVIHTVEDLDPVKLELLGTLNGLDSKTGLDDAVKISKKFINSSIRQLTTD